MLNYNLLGLPGDIDIICPRCRACASYMRPFDFYSAKQDIPEHVQNAVHNWGSDLVVELYPTLMPWVPPGRKEGYTESTGIALCPTCHFAAPHKLEWPEDAFYKWNIRGHTLWACSTEHARTIREFLGSDERDEALYGPYYRSLRKLPSEFLSAKVRKRIVKAISKSLAAAER